MRTAMMGLVILAMAACGGDDDGGGGGDLDAAPHPGDGGVEVPSIGEVTVFEVEDHGYDGAPTIERGSIIGQLRDAPAIVYQHEVMREGACRLLEFEPKECDPSCSNGICGDNNVCQPFPAYLSSGTMTISGLAGLSGGKITLEPYEIYKFYSPSVALPGDLFADDAIVKVSTVGADDLPAFTAEVPASPRLVTSIESYRITLAGGEDHVISWTPLAAADAGLVVRLQILSTNSSHGLPWNAIISCEAPDAAGQIRIPAAMIDDFPATTDWEACVGVECPRSWISRTRRAYVPAGEAGRVLVEVGRLLQFGVIHEVPRGKSHP
jgi:hypothetical protein